MARFFKTKITKMAESIRVGRKYHVYDHIVNITRTFKSKVEADEFAESLNTVTSEDTAEENNQPTNNTNGSES